VVIATRQGPSVVLDAGAVQMAARRAGLDWDNPQGLRRIIVRGGAETTSTSSAATPARGNVQVLAYARSISVGEMIQPEDLIWAKAATAPSGAPRDPDAVIGMAARRPLREGAAVSINDVSAPVVIKQGDLVTVTWSSDGITLSLQAKAMASAAVGQPFSVMNPASKKVVEAVATGPGAAVVGPEAEQLKASRTPSQIATR
jgi:flagella basal body P-ring formation protein FlgA